MEYNRSYSADVPLYTLNPIFQLVSVLLIVSLCANNKSRTVSIGRIMLYMWGLGSKRNLDKLIQLKKNKNIGDIPMATDECIINVVRQCVKDGLLDVKKDGGTALYDLTVSGRSLLYKLRQTDLYKDIEDGLKSVGILPETYVKQLEINWYAEV